VLSAVQSFCHLYLSLIFSVLKMSNQPEEVTLSSVNIEEEKTTSSSLNPRSECTEMDVIITGAENEDSSNTEPPVAIAIAPETSKPLPLEEEKTIPKSESSKDSEVFLTPPPASTLLIRRTKSSGGGTSTYVVSASSPPVASASTSLEDTGSSGEALESSLNIHDSQKYSGHGSSHHRAYTRKAVVGNNHSSCAFMLVLTFNITLMFYTGLRLGLKFLVTIRS